MKTRKPFYASIGSVSVATLRTQDLLPSFLWEARRLRLSRDERNAVRKIDARVSKISNGEFGDSDAYWSDEVSQWDLEEVSGILEAHALPYFYFGAHDGDGADFGFWLSEGFKEEFDGLRVNDTSEVPRGFSGEVLHVNDHGNMTLYRATRGRLREVWAII